MKREIKPHKMGLKMRKKNKKHEELIMDSGIVEKKDIMGGVVIAVCVVVIVGLLFLAVGAIANL